MCHWKHFTDSDLKAGWKDSFPLFMQEVKNLVARDLTGIGTALKRGVDLLNQFRIQTGIDNYGMVWLTLYYLKKSKRY